MMGDQCEAGCKVFRGGERRHRKDCVFYEESFTQMYDRLESTLEALQAENAELKAERDEFIKRAEQMEALASGAIRWLR